MSIELKPHAYDPVTNPELFEGVLARRADRLPDRLRHHLSIPVVFAAMFIFVVGIVTLGLGWALLLGCCRRLMVIWAIVYYGLTSAARPPPPSACG